MTADEQIEQTIVALGEMRRWLKRNITGPVSWYEPCLIAIVTPDDGDWFLLAGRAFADGATFTTTPASLVGWSHESVRLDFAAGVGVVLARMVHHDELPFAAVGNTGGEGR